MCWNSGSEKKLATDIETGTNTDKKENVLTSLVCQRYKTFYRDSLRIVAIS
jgi:hypothetical protein